MSDWLIAATFIKPLRRDKLKCLKTVDFDIFHQALYRPKGPLLWPFGVAIFVVAQWRNVF